jgi:hypothetical protein
VLIAVIGTWLGYPIVDPIIGLLMASPSYSSRATPPCRCVSSDGRGGLRAGRTGRVCHRRHRESRPSTGCNCALGHRLYAEIVAAADPGLTIAQSEAIADHLTHHLYHAMPTLSEATIAVVPAGAKGEAFGRESAHHRAAA